MLTEPHTKNPKRRTKWRRAIISLLLVIVLLWAISKACTDARVMLSRPFKIIHDRSWNKLLVTGKEKNLQAFSDDLLLAIAKREQLPVEIFNVSPGSALEQVEEGTYDGVISTLTPTPLNEDRFLFSDTFYRLGAVLVVQEESDVKSLAEMESTIIGIPREESTFFDIGIYPKLVFYSYQDEIDALEDLDQDKIDGVIMNAWPAYVLTQGIFQGKLKVATAPFTLEGIRLVMRKDKSSEIFIRKFNEGLGALRQDGTYEDFISKWGLIDTEISEKSEDQ